MTCLLYTSLALAAFSAVIFILWPSFSGILVARIVNGVSLGAALATATAYMLELDAALHPGTRSGRGLAVSTVVNIGGLGFGALISGLFAQYVAHPLVVPYVVFLVALVPVSYTHLDVYKRQVQQRSCVDLVQTADSEFRQSC